MKKSISPQVKTKFLATFVLLLLFCSGIYEAKAQLNTSTYSFSFSTGTYTPISGGTVLGSTTSDDQVYIDTAALGGTIVAAPSGPGFDIGFNFMFNGFAYDKFGVNTNGWIALGQSTLTPSVNMSNASGGGYFSPIISDGFAGQPLVLQNRIAILCSDLQGQTGSSIRIQTIGTAPTRTCVIQWEGYRKFGSTSDTFNFQIRLNETSNSVVFGFGTFISDANNAHAQLGLKAATTFLNRTNGTFTSAWLTSSAGTLNTNSMNLVDTVYPAAGLMYIWTEIPKTYSSSIVTTSSILPVAPGDTNQQMIRLNLVVSGNGSFLPITNINLSTTGTTSLSDISNIKIYSTDTSLSFSRSTQFGSTVSSPASLSVFTDSINLKMGNNYFWVTYDIASGATISDYLDAAIPSITIGGIIDTPSITSPSGNRQVQAPMTYISSDATHPSLSSIAQGNTNNQMLQVMVRMSSTGSPINISQLDFNTNGGGVDTSNIAAAKVYYTGNSLSFSSTTQFGSTYSVTSPTSATWGSFSITGSQALNNDTNYFWLVYDLKTTAVIGDSVDAEISSMTIASVGHTPTTTAPAGNIKIRASYCTSRATNIRDEEIWNVTFGSLNNTSSCSTTGGSGSILNEYSDYTATVAAPTILRGATIPFSLLTSWCNTSAYTASMGIFIDYNNNGVFTDAGENVYQSGSFTGTLSGVTHTGSVIIPCNAAIGQTRLRIVLQETSASVSSCGTYTWGETEDYTINIQNNPLAYISSSAIQDTNIVAPGTTNTVILKIPVKATGCGVGTMAAMYFNTIGTTSASDITAAKLYATGNSNIFNTIKLLGTVTSPSGQFSFTALTDTILSNTTDTNNYWLVYDISSSATLTDVIDARIDSIYLINGNFVPLNNNPAGNRVITAPMSYVSSDASHPSLSSIAQGNTNNQMLRVMVRMSSTGSPINLTQLDFSTNGGGVDTSNIADAKVYYSGNNSTFSSTNQFGSTYSVSSPTSATWGSFSITGSQTLNNDTNFFWLVYDLKTGAAIGDSVDAEISSITIASVAHTPSTTAPVGNIKIRAPYCTSRATSTADEEIWNVTFGSLNNTSNCSTLASGSGSILNEYSNYTTLTPTNVLRGATVPLSVLTSSCGGNYTSYLAVYIDYNGNGLFTDAGETVYTSGPFTGSNSGILKTGSVVIPCNASLGQTEMRVIYQESSAPSSCGTYTWGETEDYTINIQNNPLAYISSSAIQDTNIVAPGTTNTVILKIPVKATGCGVGTMTAMYFNTAGSTSSSDITAAKLYATGNSNIFNTSKLLATITSPSGQFSFTALADTILSNTTDTNNYWLVYDISSSATLTHVVDARIDSISLINGNFISSNNNPSGNRVINAPMSYVSSDASHPLLSNVAQGNTNNQMLRVMVKMSSTGSPVNLTQLDFSTNGGGVDTSNIADAKVYYSGNSSVFSTTNQFGSAYTVSSPTSATWGSFSITGSQALNNDSNYFWMVYDLKIGAVIGDSVDAEMSSMTIATTAHTPTTTSFAGNRKIRAPYCTPVYTSGTVASDAITNVNYAGINNTSGASSSPYLTYYNTIQATVTAGGNDMISISVAPPGGNEYVGMWIDFNDDGTFSTSERLINNSYTSGYNLSQNITIPLRANLGVHRMRFRISYSSTGGNFDPCSSYTYGETEDYNVNVLPAPTPTIYVWNQTGSASFMSSSNWTPSRNNINQNDILEFNSGSSDTITNVPTQTVSQIIVSNTTNVTLNAISTSILTVSDSLYLTSGNIVTNTNTTISLGTSVTSTGAISGSGKIDGQFRRWISASTASYVFPMIVGTNNRSVIINFTTAPTTGGTLAYNFISTAPSNTGLPLVDGSININTIDVSGVFRLTNANGLSGGSYTGIFNAYGFAGFSIYPLTSLVQRNNSSSSWTLNGTLITTSGSNSSPVLSRSGMTSFGEFGVGGDTSYNALPVNLLNLSAKNINGDVALDWSTASELNNKGFDVESSAEGFVFNYVKFVKGAGNSSTLVTYSTIDERAFNINHSDKLYYRLKQVDADGKYTYSQVVSTTNKENILKTIISYPNPFNQYLTLEFNSESIGNGDIKITDISGIEILSKQITVGKGNNKIDLFNFENLSNGIYFVRVLVNGDYRTMKITKIQ